MELLELLSENLEALSLIAGFIGYLLVEGIKLWAGKPLVDVEKERAFYTAVTLAGLLYLVPALKLAYAQPEMAVPWVRIIFGTILAMAWAVGLYEGNKNVRRSVEAIRDKA